ncbi:MAG: DUF4358 domain-containing protein [Oscillospiraceae bacterium]|nr:DUF4358 domain-containing protein [Oscillospiraceae bacterium]
MKKTKVLIIIIVLILFCAAMLFSCGQESEINIELWDLADVIGEKIDLSNTVPYNSGKISDEFGISEEDAAQIIMLKEMDVNSAEILILIEAKDKETVKDIEIKLKTYKANKLNELKDYTANPDNENQYYIVDDSEIMIEQQYLFLAINKQNKEINNIIKEYIKNNKAK